MMGRGGFVTFFCTIRSTDVGVCEGVAIRENATAPRQYSSCVQTRNQDQDYPDRTQFYAAANYTS